jgi:hypothetical protein
MSEKKEGAENNSAPSRKFIHHDDERNSDGSSDTIQAQLERRRAAAKRTGCEPSLSTRRTDRYAKTNQV